MFIFFYDSSDPRTLHSFPTRRSSDLIAHRDAHLHDLEHADLAGVAPALRGRDGLDRLDSFDVLHARNGQPQGRMILDRKSTRLNSSHPSSSYAVFCLKKKNHFMYHSI